MFGAISFGAVLTIIVLIYAVVTYRGYEAAKGKGAKEGKEGFVVNPLDPTGERAKEFAIKIPPLGGGPKPTSLPVSRDVTGVLPSELPGPTSTTSNLRQMFCSATLVSSPISRICR